ATNRRVMIAGRSTLTGPPAIRPEFHPGPSLSATASTDTSPPCAKASTSGPDGEGRVFRGEWWKGADQQQRMTDAARRDAAPAQAASLRLLRHGHAHGPMPVLRCAAVWSLMADRKPWADRGSRH